MTIRVKRLTQIQKLEAFIEKASAIHNGKYDYALVVEHVHAGNQMRNADKVPILCPIHGVFHQKTRYHLDGSHCPDCGNANRGSSKLRDDVFIDKMRLIHPTLDFSEFVYTGNKDKSIVICHKHGSFLARPNDLLGGENRKPTECRACALIKRGGYHNYATLQSAQVELQQSPGKFYFLKFTNVNTNFVFYKVGITKEKRWERRFGRGAYTDYDIEPIHIFEDTYLECARVESFALIQLYDLSIKELLPDEFQGRGECFEYSEETYERVLKILNNLSS